MRNKIIGPPVRLCNLNTSCKKFKCCDRPAPMNRADAMLNRNQKPSNVDYSSTECYSCNHICRCNSNFVKSINGNN